MTQVVDISEDADRALALRHGLTQSLIDAGMITSAMVEAAFRTVPRHLFVPAGTPLEIAYNPDEAVVTKRDARGVSVSSVSAPFIQARMIEQADVRPGMRVLEIGSGGYNAALLAEVVGRDGRVVSVDIDAEVTDRASALLDATGYGSRIRVVQADAQHPVPDAGPFERIIVTVGACDIPPAWPDQLTDDGMIVVPLRMNGITRTIAFRRQANHLVGTSAEVAGFIAMQGEGEHAERVVTLTDRQDRQVKLHFDTGAPAEPDLLHGALGAGWCEAWSGVTIKRQTSFADLYLWFAGFLPGFCRITAEDGTDLVEGPGKTWFPFAVVRGDSFAVLAVRPAPNAGEAEFGARAYGTHAEPAAAATVDQIRAWDRHARSGPPPKFAFWPNSSRPIDVPGGAAVFEKPHGVVTVTWPIGG